MHPAIGYGDVLDVGLSKQLLMEAVLLGFEQAFPHVLVNLEATQGLHALLVLALELLDL